MSPAQIKKLRKQLGLTQTEFADKVGVSRRTAQGWEADDKPHVPSQLAEASLRKLKTESELCSGVISR